VSFDTSAIVAIAEISDFTISSIIERFEREKGI
jgi:hypothetical protein